MSIYISKNGQTFGPHEPTEIAVFLRNGTFSSEDYCWKEGWSEWRPLSSALAVFKLSATPPAPASRPPATAPAPPPAGNFIPEDVEITGSLKLSSPQTLSCRLKGSLSSSSPLVIAKEAHIEANISAESVSIAGIVTGNIKVESLARIQGTGRLHGDIHASRIAIEEGATFSGSSHVTSAKHRDAK